MGSRWLHFDYPTQVGILQLLSLIAYSSVGGLWMEAARQDCRLLLR
jgi:hypothetical protein